LDIKVFLSPPPKEKMANITILDPKNPIHKSLFPHAMTDIHMDCIQIDNTMATFMPPLDRNKIINWYHGQIRQVEAGDREIVMEWVERASSSAIDDKSKSGSDGEEQKEEEREVVTWEGKELAGFVMLLRAGSETGPWRGMVEKLLVSPRHRYKGVARRVMEGLEKEAIKSGHTVLVSFSRLSLI
jgi:GNAT superfamily N-acetyltransferase